jgi:hypothetical protein
LAVKCPKYHLLSEITPGHWRSLLTDPSAA